MVKQMLKAGNHSALAIFGWLIFGCSFFIDHVGLEFVLKTVARVLP